MMACASAQYYRRAAEIGSTRRIQVKMDAVNTPQNTLNTIHQSRFFGGQFFQQDSEGV
jgi:hypothetical protein